MWAHIGSEDVLQLALAGSESDSAAGSSIGAPKPGPLTGHDSPHPARELQRQNDIVSIP